MRQLEGEGLRDITRTIGRVARKVFFGQNDLPPRMQSFVDRFGQEIIVSITIVREPVQSTIRHLLNTLSFGKFQENIDRLGYDTIYHLSLDIVLANGVRCKLEKNERLSISEAKYNKDGDTQTFPLSISSTPQTMIGEALKKTELHMGKANFLNYSAYSRNCQHFIIGFLEANGWLTPDARDFILQDAAQLFESLPYLRNIADRVTNLGTSVDTIIQGGRLQVRSPNGYHQMSRNEMIYHMRSQKHRRSSYYLQ